MADSLASPPLHVRDTLHHFLAPALPGIPALIAIVVGLVVLLWYLVRVPQSYPFRSAILALASLALVMVGGALTYRVLERTAPATHGLPAAIKTVVDKQIMARPVEPLNQYVPPFPGADSAVRHDQPSVGGLPSGTIWDETTTRSIEEVVRYYKADDNHLGWQIEFDAQTGVVLRRTTPVLGQLEVERLRVQAMPNPDRHGPRTRIEFELTRRVK